MTDAREIIALTIEPFVHHADDVTSVVVNTLTAAGYRILGPGELDAKAVERSGREAEAALSAPMATATFRHKKRGTEYVLLGFGKMQARDWVDHGPELDYDTASEEDCVLDLREVDMREVAIYRSIDDGSLWVRPREEFEDGRFEALTAEGPLLAAGFRIIGPEEVDPVTVEKCAQVAERAGNPVGASDGGTYAVGSATDAAAAIRALEKQEQKR